MIDETITNASILNVLAKEAALLQLEYNGIIISTTNNPAVVLGRFTPYGTRYIENNALSVPALRSAMHTQCFYLSSDCVYVSIITDKATGVNYVPYMQTELTTFIEANGGTVTFDGCMRAPRVNGQVIATWGVSPIEYPNKCLVNFVIYTTLDETEVGQVIDIQNNGCAVPTAGLNEIGINSNTNSLRNQLRNVFKLRFNIDDGVTDEDISLYNSTTAVFETIMQTDRWIKDGTAPK